MSELPESTSSHGLIQLKRFFKYFRHSLSLHIFESVLIILIFTVYVKADDVPSELTGLIIDRNSEEVISSAFITLESASGSFYSVVESDFFGNFEFRNIPGGEYQMKVKRLGYQTYVKPITFPEGSKLKMNIYLTPISYEIEKINVTATKSELTLQKTPSSINIIRSEEIQNRNIMTFDQVLENVQGITINRTSPINVNSLSIRGSSDVAGGGIGNRVLLLIDGRPSLTGDSKGALWSLIPVSVVEKTEIVKGAFSSLYGSSAIGGVINVITKRPTYKSSTSVNLNYGFYEKLSDSLRFSDKLMKFGGVDFTYSNTVNKFAYLLNFNFKNNSGYAQQTEYKFYSGFGKFTYDLFTDRDLEFTIQYTNSVSAYPHYWRKDAGKYAEPYKVSPNLLNDRINKESQNIDLFYRAIPNSSSKYISRFYYYRLSSESEYNPDNPVSKQFGKPGQVFKTNITSYNFGNTSQVDFSLGKNNFLISGIDLQWNIVRSAPADIVYGNQQQYNLGFFVQDQIDLIKDKAGNALFSSTVASRLDFNKFTGGKGVYQISPKLSFVFSPSVKSGLFESSSLRLLFGRAFRTPSIAEQFLKKELFGGFDFKYNPDLKPEVMYSAEIGVRKQYDDRFILDLSFFFNKFDNLIQYVNIGNNIYGPFQVQNIAKSQIKGFEFLINYASKFIALKKIFGYKFEFSYSYIDARDLSLKRSDDFLPYKPRHLLNININLDYLNFDFNANGRFVDKIDEVLFFKNEEPKSYFLVDLKLSKRIYGNINVYIAVNNLTDVFYQELERIAAPNRNYSAGININF